MAARQFFEALASGRELEHDHPDPVEFARANGLMVLFNAGVRAVFESHLERMPTDIEARWRDLIAGGARSEAFGPLTLQERLDERQVETALVAGRRQRIVNLFVTLVLIVGVAVGASWGWQEFGPGEDRTRGALQFAGTDEPADVAD